MTTLQEHLDLHALDALSVAFRCRPHHSVSTEVVQRALAGLPISRNKAQSIADAISQEHGLPKQRYLRPEDMGIVIHDEAGANGDGSVSGSVGAHTQPFTNRRKTAPR